MYLLCCGPFPSVDTALRTARGPDHEMATNRGQSACIDRSPRGRKILYRRTRRTSIQFTSVFAGSRKIGSSCVATRTQELGWTLSWRSFGAFTGRRAMSSLVAKRIESILIQSVLFDLSPAVQNGLVQHVLRDRSRRMRPRQAFEMSQYQHGFIEGRLLEPLHLLEARVLLDHLRPIEIDDAGEDVRAGPKLPSGPSILLQLPPRQKCESECLTPVSQLSAIWELRTVNCFLTTEAQLAPAQAGGGHGEESSTLEPPITQIYADHVIASAARQSEPATGYRLPITASGTANYANHPARPCCARPQPKADSHKDTKTQRRRIPKRRSDFVALWFCVRTKYLCSKDLRFSRSEICARRQDSDK